MPVEIEIKLKVDDLAPIRSRLKELGAQRVGEVIETNIFFDTPDRALLANDCGLRVRRKRDVTGSEKDKLVITYKGARSEGPVKRREEIEVAVDRFDNAITLLERLGYTRNLKFEKRRESWKIEKSLVELDSLPELGCFIEIEAPTQTEVLKIRERLGLSDVPGVTKTYADLVTHHLAERGVRGAALTFAG